MKLNKMGNGKTKTIRWSQHKEIGGQAIHPKNIKWNTTELKAAMTFNMYVDRYRHNFARAPKIMGFIERIYLCKEN